MVSKSTASNSRWAGWLTAADTLNVVEGRKDRLRADVELALGLVVLL